MTLDLGFHRLSKEEYLADPCETPSLSTSIAQVIMDESPAHAWACHPRGLALKDDPTRAMIRGTAVDSLLLGGDAELVCLPEMLPNAKGALYPTNGEFRMDSAKAWKLEQLAAGRTVISPSDLEAAHVTAAVVREKLANRGIVLNGQHQVTAIWKEGAVFCRGRLDHLAMTASEAVIYDLKVVEKAHPKAIAKKMNDFGYDMQHAAYVRAVEALRPDLAGRVKMKFIFAEFAPPYAVVTCHPSGELRALGEFRWRRAVERFGACLASGIWPEYAEREIEIPALPWAMAQMLEEEARVAA